MTNLVCDRIRCCKATRFIRNVYFHNTDNLLRIYLQIRCSDTVTWLIDWNFTTIWRVNRFVHIMESQTFCTTVCRIQFNNDMIGQTGNGRSNTSTGGQIDSTVRSNMTSFDNGYIQLSVITITQFLSHLRKVNIIISHLAIVHRLTEIGIGGIRCTIAERFGTNQGTISRISGRSTGENTNLERTTCGVFSFGNFCNFWSYGLRRTGWRKTAETYIISMFDISSGFGR